MALVPSKAKGIGNSTTLSSDALTEEDAHKVLLSLCESVGQRLRSSHQLQARYAPRSATAIFAMFLTRCPWPSLPPLRICCWKVLFPYSANCGTELPSGCWVYAPPSWYPRVKPVQLSLFDYTAPRSEKQQKLDAALDDIRAKYGKDAVKRGSFV